MIDRVDRGEPRDRPAATRHDDVGTIHDALEMLAEPVVELTHPDLVSLDR